ncbi:uncharacterized protein LOC111698542 [Eurytemora carolleeae]|uniref:uncharacterized protein LOC111698542 n=1 Tax=Eurytemora carolleeae TaxID=1294199 RepID=UPI000C7932A3|nr:uncharacterized protein LOC111698542 [Eurytemora carolleeae]|eukprot:XP_023324667.1 uncharacterized protein LOC111698542 [Eurytemora affinis]
MLQRSWKKYFFSGSTVPGDPVVVDETGVDIIQALDIFSPVQPSHSSPGSRRAIPPGLKRDDDFHSPGVGDLALHSPRFSSPRPPPCPSRLQPCPPRPPPCPSNLKDRTLNKLLDKLCEENPERTNYLRKKNWFNGNKNSLSKQKLEAVKRGKERVKDSCFIPEPSQGSTRSSNPISGLKLESEPQDLFSGYKNALTFTGTLSDELGRFLPASFLFPQSYPTIGIHQSTGWITVSVLDIHTLQVENTGQLITVLHGNSRLVLTLLSALETQEFMSALEYKIRYWNPFSTHLLVFHPTRLNTKLEVQSFLGKWNSVQESHRLEPIGEFWYKVGDHTDTRDWSTGFFYLKFGVLYCCREEGELPVLTLELSDLPTRLPDLGNRFLIQVGSSLTLSSPSLNLATWTRSVLHSASFFKMRDDVVDYRLTSFHINNKDLILVREPQGEVFQSFKPENILRVQLNPAILTVHMGWIQDSRIGGGSILLREPGDYKELGETLAQMVKVEEIVNMGSKYP